MQDPLQLMSEIPVFVGLEEETLELLASRALPVTVDEGKHFFLEGDRTQAMYVLLSGRVGIYKSWQGESKLLRWMEAGDCFGEMALVDLFSRSASALATERCEALEITPPDLLAVHVHDPEQYSLLHMNISREISSRLRRVDELLFRALMGDPLPETIFDDYS